MGYAVNRAAIGTAAILLLATQAASAQIPETAPHPPRDFNTYIPTGKATRIDPTEAPTIDGDLSDPAWAKAQPIDEFYQLDPGTGQPGTEQTVARFIYDSNNLYVSIFAYDREPDLQVATTQTRDAMLGVEDTVRIYLDPLNTRRNSYYFEMNALGARVEALIQNNNDYIKEWNTIWTGRAMRNEFGFSVEMAIPFRDLATDPTKPDWVLEISRNIRRKGERLRWSSISAATQFSDISRSGTLTGITGIDNGLGLDVQLYGAMRYSFDWPKPGHETKSFRPSGNAYYKITPLLTGTLTVNPDFSDAPLDLRQVNTTRFSLFTPETRNFFLQDVATFEFGGRGFTTGFNYNYSADNGQAFFSRNIGIANGLPVSIIGGGKFSGEYAGFSVGALSTVTNGTGLNQRSQVLSVARVTRDIGESKAGFIVTNGDPTGVSENTVTGIDYQYRDSNFFPGKILLADTYYQRSFSNTEGQDDSWGLALTYPNERLGGEVHIKQIGRNFSPALGFANRTGIRQYDGRVLYRNRDLGWRWLDFGTLFYAVTSLDNHLESRENAIYAGISTRRTDEFVFRLFDNFEHVPAPFRIAGKVPVPAGRYDWNNFSFYYRGSEGRPYYIRADFYCCSFYNGDYFKIDLITDWRANRYLQFSPHYTYTYISLPGGLVNIHLLLWDTQVNFTPDMQVAVQAQFDNISEKFQLSLRYRWEYEPGQELFASFGQTGNIPGEPTFVPQTSQVIVRLGHTFRF